jgi:hypothetical protein
MMTKDKLILGKSLCIQILIYEFNNFSLFLSKQKGSWRRRVLNLDEKIVLIVRVEPQRI